MDISAYVNEYVSKKRYYGLSCSANFVHNLIVGDKRFAFTKQRHFEDSECLAYNIQSSVAGCERNKKEALEVYKHFLKFLREKGIDVKVEFPTIDICNSFERLMYIAKHFHDPKETPTTKKVSEKLWVSEATIRSDLRKLLGEDDDPIQVCGKKFVIDGAERRRGTVLYSSTPHPIFLAHNLSQVMVTLKGLKTMSENPLYADYAKTAAADIWEQLSDYAKNRIRIVFSELLPEDYSWYANLKSLKQEDNDECFYTEYRCSEINNILDCMKNEKVFYAEYDGPEGIQIYQKCRCVPRSYNGSGLEVDCTIGRVWIDLDKVIKTSYTVEGLL